MAMLLPWLKARFFDSNGRPLEGGKLYSYRAGTSAKASTFADASGAVPNTNPVILDANGEASIWVGDLAYKFILKDENDVEQWTVDNVKGGGSGGGSGSGVWITHEIADGQAATDLDGETIDFDGFSSAECKYEIIRGTTIVSNGSFVVQDLNGTGRIVLGGFQPGVQHGITFSITQDEAIVQIRAAASSGPGGGTIKLQKNLVPK